MMKRCLVLLFCFILIACASRKPAQTSPMPDAAELFPDSEFLTGLLASEPGLFDSILKNRSRYQVRIIYTQINRNEKNEPSFIDHYFNVRPRDYFYPASTVKLPAAVLSLQRLNELGISGLNRNSTMITEASFPGHTPVYNDPTTPDGRPSIAHYIKKILLVSDNDAFNRLYEFLGQEYLNDTLRKMGWESTRIIHRLNISLSEEGNRRTNPVLFYDTSGQLLYSQPERLSSMDYGSEQVFLGKGFHKGGKLVNEPFDFSKKNRIDLPDLHSMMKSVMFPQSVPAKQRFLLTDDDYRFLYRYMSMKPGESKYPEYDSSFNGAYSKLLLYGGKGEPEDGVRIFNKEGDAYGFLTDVAYIVDFNNGVEFLLSAGIYCNSDEIFNDDHYDYEEIGFPFLKNLGRVLYQYEKKREKKYKPDLSGFKLNYEE